MERIIEKHPVIIFLCIFIFIRGKRQIDVFLIDGEVHWIEFFLPFTLTVVFGFYKWWWCCNYLNNIIFIVNIKPGCLL